MKRKQNNEDRNEKNRIKFENAVNFCNDGEAPNLNQLIEYLDMKERTVRSWIDRYGYKIDKDSKKIIRISDE